MTATNDARPTGAYAWLNDEPGPRMLLEALKLFGVLEAAGAANNPAILAWADEIGAAERTAYAKWAADWYAADSTPWCGLFMALCAVRANVDGRAERRPPTKYLSALAWTAFGVPIKLDSAELGDVLIFQRPGGGHVGLYVGEDEVSAGAGAGQGSAFHVLGGNQGDAVSIARIAKARCVAVRRVPYLSKPANVRKVRMGAGGPLSTNED